MHRQSLFLLLVMLGLSLAACSPLSSAAGGPQAAQIPAVDAAPADSGANEDSQAAIVSGKPPETCPVTRPSDPAFLLPSPYPQTPPGDYAWYGSSSLWTAVPGSGVWSDLPLNPGGYTQKVFWWREGYSWTGEPEPALSVTGRRLDAPAPKLNASKATNAFADDIQSAMLVGVDFPTTGCWEVTGRYAEAELSFVVWVAP